MIIAIVLPEAGLEERAVAAAKRIQERAEALKAEPNDKDILAPVLDFMRAVGAKYAVKPGYRIELLEADATRANDNKPGGRDLVGHSSVQAWSAGPIFPAVIARVETYGDEDSLHPGMLYDTHWVLYYPGRLDHYFTSYDEAFQFAQRLNGKARAAA